MSARCPRLFEAEALRDGRLSGPEVTRFQAHLKGCPSCMREAHALQALGNALRAPLASSTASSTDELHVRRERTRLLAAFDASLVPAPRGHRRLWLAGAAACVVLAALVVSFFGPPRQGGSAVAPRPAVHPPVAVRADSSAKWSREADGQLERIILQTGTLSIRVAHSTSQRRLLVTLPDGELEDIGTTFSVSADAGQTTRVSVQEGRVVLRLRGRPPLSLRAGDSWSPSASNSPSGPAASAPSFGPAASPLPPEPAAAASASGPAASSELARSAAPPASTHAMKALRPRTAQSSLGPAPSAVGSGAPQLEADPAADFLAAMTALNSGDNRGASARFAAFINEHPRDSRAQDAAYLRVIALQRAGDTNAMKQAAGVYLNRYPNGFRKTEVESLSH